MSEKWDLTIAEEIDLEMAYREQLALEETEPCPACGYDSKEMAKHGRCPRCNYCERC